MSKSDTYIQVQLERQGAHLTTFIEAKYADTRLQVSLEDQPEEFWNVAEVYPSSEISSQMANERAHRWQQYRARTDI